MLDKHSNARYKRLISDKVKVQCKHYTAYDNRRTRPNTTSPAWMVNSGNSGSFFMPFSGMSVG